MFLKLRPLIYSLIFFIGLELIVFWHDNVLFLASFLFLMSIYHGIKSGGKLRYSILPAFFVLSSVSLLYLVTINFEQQIFIILSSIMYYLSLFGAYRLGKYDSDQTAKGMIMAATAATIFFTYAGVYGLYLNFNVPLFYLMLAYLAVTLLVSYQYFSIILADKDCLKSGCSSLRAAWIYSFILSLAVAEIIWALNFWPFGYLTVGVSALILYFILWDIVQSYFLDNLNKKRVIANIIFFSIMIFLVLITSKWIPVI